VLLTDCYISLPSILLPTIGSTCAFVSNEVLLCCERVCEPVSCLWWRAGEKMYFRELLYLYVYSVCGRAPGRTSSRNLGETATFGRSTAGDCTPSLLVAPYKRIRDKYVVWWNLLREVPRYVLVSLHTDTAATSLLSGPRDAGSFTKLLYNNWYLLNWLVPTFPYPIPGAATRRAKHRCREASHWRRIIHHFVMSSWASVNLRKIIRWEKKASADVNNSTVDKKC